MPQILTQARIDILEQHVNAGDRIAYYTQLSEWGYRYADLALQVVLNDGLAGRVANEFFEINSEEQGQFLTANQLADMSDQLMRLDFQARSRQDSPNRLDRGDGMADELSVLDIQAYHQAAFAEQGVSIDAWTPFFLLNAQPNDGAREAYWDNLLQSVSVQFGATFVASVGPIERM